MPSLVNLYDEFKSRNFVILSVDIGEKKAVVKKLVEKMKLPFPVLLDTDGKVAKAYGIRAHPTHFLIDGDGKMLGMTKGGRDWGHVKSRDLIRFLVEQNTKSSRIEADHPSLASAGPHP